MAHRNNKQNNTQRNWRAETTQEPSDEPTYQTSRKPAGKTPSKSNRDKKRSDAYREKKGQELTETTIKSNVEDVLFKGFEDLKQVIEEMSTIVTKNPSALPVTTRGIGFDTYMIYKHIQSTIKNLARMQCADSVPSVISAV